MLYKGRYNNQLESLALLAAGIVFAAGTGALAGLGSFDMTLVAVVGLAGVVALLRPVASLYLLVVGGLVVVGLARLYFPGMEKIQWGVAGLATALGGIGVLGFLFKPEPVKDIPPNSGILCVLLLLIGASALINLQSVSQFVYGFKGYAQVMGLFFALVALRVPNKSLNRLPKLLVAIALFQLPFVLHQWLVLVPQRVSLASGIVAEDVVAGTMGASATGGGSNAILSILLITAIAIVAAGYKRGQLKPWRSALICMVCSIPLFLNANRVASLYLLIAFLMIFGPALFRRASRFLAAAVLTVLIVTGTVWVNLNFGSRSAEYADWQDLVVTTVERNMAPDIGYGALELNRAGSITFWWTEQIEHPDLKNFLFGNGPGAAREATGSALPVKTLAATRYAGVGIGLTGISSLLWELGIVGLLVVVVLHVNAFRSAHYLVSSLRSNPFRQYVAEGLKVGVVLFFLCLFHKNTFVFHITYQTLVYLVFGILSAWHFHLERTQATAARIRKQTKGP
ncbi:MAG TPA: hypothetical protein VFY03_06840 [Woeseiaceae bacterium]|nr:hypothetical protein [Woeseiaceae bacterium]